MHRISSRSSARRGVSAVQVLVPIVLVLGGLGVAAALVMSRPEVAQGEAAELATPVEVVAVRAGAQLARVHGTGVVGAEQQVVLTPEVGGRLTWVSDALLPGGRLASGDVLARIDPRDYQLQVTQAEASVQQARVALDLERSRGEVARREWALAGDGRAFDEVPLAVRQPQLASAERALAAAEAQLEAARLALSRTQLRAPFDALVLSEGVDVGQVVGAGTQVATLVGARSMRVAVQVPVEVLPSLEIPGMGGSEVGSTATVRQELTRGGAGEVAVQRTAQVIGLGGQLDPTTRTATLIVRIPEPLGDGSDLPLLPGAYVVVEIQGRPLEGVVAVPRTAIRDGQVAWVVRDDSRLDRREVQVGWRDADTLYVTSGLEDGDRVVTSPLALPLQDMAVSVVEPGQAQAESSEVTR